MFLSVVISNFGHLSCTYRRSTKNAHIQHLKLTSTIIQPTQTPPVTFVRSCARLSPISGERQSSRSSFSQSFSRLFLICEDETARFLSRGLTYRSMILLSRSTGPPVITPVWSDQVRPLTDSRHLGKTRELVWKRLIGLGLWI